MKRGIRGNETRKALSVMSNNSTATLIGCPTCPPRHAAGTGPREPQKLAELSGFADRHGMSRNRIVSPALPRLHISTLSPLARPWPEARPQWRCARGTVEPDGQRCAKGHLAGSGERRRLKYFLLSCILCFSSVAERLVSLGDCIDPLLYLSISPISAPSNTNLMWKHDFRGRALVLAVTACSCQAFLLLGYDQGVMSGIVGADNRFARDFNQPDAGLQGDIVALYDVSSASHRRSWSLANGMLNALDRVYHWLYPRVRDRRALWAPQDAHGGRHDNGDRIDYLGDVDDGRAVDCWAYCDGRGECFYGPYRVYVPC